MKQGSFGVTTWVFLSKFGFLLL